jgi:hypothetical protein
MLNGVSATRVMIEKPAPGDDLVKAGFPVR